MFCVGFSGNKLLAYYDRMNQRIERAMSGSIDRAIIVRRGTLWSSCGANARLLVSSATGQESDIPDVGRKVESMEASVAKENS